MAPGPLVGWRAASGRGRPRGVEYVEGVVSGRGEVAAHVVREGAGTRLVVPGDGVGKDGFHVRASGRGWLVGRLVAGLGCWDGWRCFTP